MHENYFLYTILNLNHFSFRIKKLTFSTAFKKSQGFQSSLEKLVLRFKIFLLKVNLDPFTSKQVFKVFLLQYFVETSGIRLLFLMQPLSFRALHFDYGNTKHYFC